MPSRRQAIKRIVVGVDGSDHSADALQWVIRLAHDLKVEVIAVYAIPAPSSLEFVDVYGAWIVPPELFPEWRAERKRAFEEDWCKPLHDAGVAYRTVLEDGRPASVIAAVADREDADLIVVGRRGRGEVAELLLGSVSYELTHHCKRPVLLVSGPAVPRKEATAARTVASA